MVGEPFGRSDLLPMVLGREVGHNSAWCFISFSASDDVDYVRIDMAYRVHDAFRVRECSAVVNITTIALLRHELKHGSCLNIRDDDTDLMFCARDEADSVVSLDIKDLGSELEAVTYSFSKDALICALSNVLASVVGEEWWKTPNTKR